MYFPKVDLSDEYEAYVDGNIKKIRITDYKNKKIVLFFYPHDFTFVCPTEVNAMNDQMEEFKIRNAEIIFISVDSVYCHKVWAETAREKGGVMPVKWPMIADKNGLLASKFDVYDEKSAFTKRATIIMDEDHNIFYMGIHHDKIGRSTAEILRILDAMAFYKENGDICPMDWKKSKE